MSYDSFVRDRLPPAELLPEFRFDLPELHYPERFNAATELLKEGAPEDRVVVATMPLLRPGEIATVIERAQISHAIVDSRFIGDFRQAVEQTHFVKNIVKYDGDYRKGELETRTKALKPLPPAETRRDDPCI